MFDLSTTSSNFLNVNIGTKGPKGSHHCCQILHDKLGLSATARASLGVYNTKDDLDKLNESLNKCKKIFEG